MADDPALDFSSQIVKLAVNSGYSAGEVAQGQLIALCAWATMWGVDRREMHHLLSEAWDEVEAKVIEIGGEDGG